MKMDKLEYKNNGQLDKIEIIDDNVKCCCCIPIKLGVSILVIFEIISVLNIVISIPNNKDLQYLKYLNGVIILSAITLYFFIRYLCFSS